MQRFQGTVAKPVLFAGVGLHSGSLVNLEILPLPPDSGIVFQRTDLSHAERILASPSNVFSTFLSTTIGKQSNTVATIEHLMAAFWGMGIDNALVLVSAGEIPILDGSSAPFVDKFLETGVQIQHVPRAFLSVKEGFRVSEDDKYVDYVPPFDKDSAQLEVKCIVEFPSVAIGRQELDFIFTQDNFMRINEARTFCHIESVRVMREKGLALGGSLDNAVVVDNEKVLNTEGLRYSDEFVRHKILDFIGDIALLPGSLVGKITLYKNGHTLHSLFTKKFMEELKKAEKHPSVGKRIFSAFG